MMAERAPLPCRKPGCPNYQVEGGGGYCGEHRQHAQKRYDRRRGNWRQRGYDRRWERVRNRYINRNPLCETCGDAATEVHHIVPVKDGGAWYDPTNLTSCCHPCHMRKHARDE